MRKIIVLIIFAFALTNCNEEPKTVDFEYEHRVFDTMSVKARQLISEQKYSEAEILFDKFKNNDTLNYSYFVLGGKVKLSVRKPNDALYFIIKALNLKPTDELYFNLGEAYMGIGKKDEALVYLNEAIKLNPNSAYYYRIRADFYAKKEVYLIAIDDMTKAIALSNNKPEYFVIRAEYKHAYKDKEGAISDCDSSIAYDNNYCVGYINKGYYCYEVHRLKEGLASLNKAINLGCTTGSAYFRRAITRYSLGDINCVSDFKKAIELNDPEGIEFINYCKDIQIKIILTEYKLSLAKTK